MGNVLRSHRLWLLSVWEKTKGHHPAWRRNCPLRLPLFYCERLCACHSRSDLNGHPVFRTNMRRKEGAPAKKCRGTGQGSVSDHLSFCVVGTGASGPDSTWVKPRAKPLTLKLANEKTSDIYRRNHRLRRAMKQDSVISSDYTPFLGEAR